MKKFICLSMALLMFTLPILSGCGKNDEEESVNDTVVATIGDFEITAEDLDFYMTEMSSSLQGDELLDEALNMAHVYAAIFLKAQELGIYSDAQKDAFVEEQIEELGGIESIATYYGYEESAVRNYLACVGAVYAIAKENCSVADAQAIFNDDYMTVKHILFTFEGNGEGDDDANTLKKADDAYQRAVDGESFEDLINELNEDPGEDPEAGYTFTEGTMVDEFYQTSKALEIDEISKPVRTSYGYHVIKRYPLPVEGTETYDTYIESIQLENGSVSIYDDAEEWKEEYPIKRIESAIANLDLSKYASKDNYADASVFDE